MITRIDLYVFAYLAIGLVLSLAMTRKMSVYDDSLMMLFFWPFFVVLVTVRTVINSFSFFISIVAKKVKK